MSNNFNKFIKLIHTNKYFRKPDIHEINIVYRPYYHSDKYGYARTKYCFSIRVMRHTLYQRGYIQHSNRKRIGSLVQDFNKTHSRELLDTICKSFYIDPSKVFKIRKIKELLSNEGKKEIKVLIDNLKVVQESLQATWQQIRQVNRVINDLKDKQLMVFPGVHNVYIGEGDDKVKKMIQELLSACK